MSTTLNHDQHGWFTEAVIRDADGDWLASLEPGGRGNVYADFGALELELTPDQFDHLTRGLLQARAALKHDARRRAEMQARHRDLAAQRAQS